MADDKTILIEVDIDVEKSIERQIELKDAIIAQKKVLDDLKASQKENTAEYIKANAEYKNLSTELKDNERLTLNAVKATNASEGSIKQLRAQLSVVSEKWAQLSEEERVNSDIGKNLSKQKLQLTERLKLEERATGDARRNVGNYTEVLKDLSPQYASVSNKASGFLATLGKLGPAGALIAGGIAAIGAPLVAFFTKSDKGAELLQQKLAGISAAFGILGSELISAGDKMTESFDKPEKKASSFYAKVLNFVGAAFGPGFQASLTVTGMKMDLASDAAEKYTKKLFELEDAEIAQIVPRAEANKKIAEAKLLYEDETQTIQTRMAALKESLDLELETVSKEIEFQNQVISNIEIINEEKKKARTFNEQDEKKLQEAIAKRISLETDSIVKQRKLQSTLNSAEKQFQKEADDRRAAKLKKDQEAADAQIAEFEKILDAFLAEQQYEIDSQEKSNQLINESLQVNLNNRLEIYKDNIFKTLDLEREKLAIQEQQEIDSAIKIGADTKLIEEKYSKARIEITKAERDAKIAIYSDIAGNLITVFGEGTALGKAAAVAQATFSTYQAANAAYASAVTVPIVGPILGPIAAAAAVAAGLANVKKILSVKTPGITNGASNTTASTSTGSTPVAPVITNVNSQIGQGIVSRNNSDLGNNNQIKLQPTLVEDDVTAAQKRSLVKTKMSTI